MAPMTVTEYYEDLEGGPALMRTIDHERQGFLRCNTYQHAWDEYENSDYRPKFGTPFVLRCERCGTERRESWGRHGELLSRYYRYPRGYKYAKGERPTRPDFRVMLLTQRILESRQRRATT